jgi:hypothetical protein
MTSSHGVQNSLVVTWKKKQHLLNALFIVLLDGRIIYRSPLDAGSCDQNLWNKLDLRK